MKKIKILIPILFFIILIFSTSYAFAQTCGLGGGCGSGGAGGAGGGFGCPLPPPPPGPGGDHPDETQSVGTLGVNETYYLTEIADCMILFNPDIPYKNFTSLLSKLKIPIIYSDIYSSVVEMQEVQNKILILPTGSLAGLETSEILKTNLSEFVKQGGILVVFTQQQGYEFSVLPGSYDANY